MILSEVGVISIIRKADIALIIVLTAMAIVGMAVVLMQRVSGGFVEIVQHGQVVTTLELGTDTIHTVETGKLFNVVQIAHGSVKMLDANCPDKHCLHHAPIMFSGQTIVCLPNRLIIQVRSAEEGAHDVIIR